MRQGRVAGIDAARHGRDFYALEALRVRRVEARRAFRQINRAQKSYVERTLPRKPTRYLW